MSTPQEIQAAILECKVLKLLGISESLYNQYYFDCAFDWLEQFTDADRDIIGLLTSSPVFWAWWRNQWRIVDRVFYARITDPRALPCDRVAEWRRVHAADNISMFPTSRMLAETFRQMRDGVAQELEAKTQKVNKQ